MKVCITTLDHGTELVGQHLTVAEDGDLAAVLGEVAEAEARLHGCVIIHCTTLTLALELVRHLPIEHTVAVAWLQGGCGVRPFTVKVGEGEQ